MIIIAKIFAYLFSFETQIYYIYKSKKGHSIALTEHRGKLVINVNGTYFFSGRKIVLTQAWESK